MAYNSKYTGEQVEAQLDKVDGKADKTYVDAEVAAAKEYASGELSSVREDLEAADQDLKLYVDEQTLASKDYTDFKTKDKYVKPSSGTSAYKIVVPDDLYNTWIAATNWSTHASKIIKASEFNG